MKKLREKKGLTLVELLVTLGLLMLVLFMIWQFFDFSGKFFRKSDDTASMQDQARIIAVGLRKDLGTALSVSILPDPDPASLTLSSAEKAIYVSGGLLRRRDSSGTVETIYSSAAHSTLVITFSRESDTLLHMIISIQGKTLVDTSILLQNTTLPADSPPGGTVIYQPSR